MFPDWPGRMSWTWGHLLQTAGGPTRLPLSFLESAFLTSASGDSRTGGLEALVSIVPGSYQWLQQEGFCLPPFLFVYNSPSYCGIWWGGARGTAEHPKVPGQPLPEEKKKEDKNHLGYKSGCGVGKVQGVTGGEGGYWGCWDQQVSLRACCVPATGWCPEGEPPMVKLRALTNGAPRPPAQNGWPFCASTKCETLSSALGSSGDPRTHTLCWARSSLPSTRAQWVHQAAPPGFSLLPPIIPRAARASSPGTSDPTPSSPAMLGSCVCASPLGLGFEKGRFTC